MILKRNQSQKRPAFNQIRKGLLASFLAYTILLAGFNEFNPSAIDLAISQIRFRILDWELANIPKKWTNRLDSILQGNSNKSREDRIAETEKFFNLGIELRELEQKILLADIPSDNISQPPGFSLTRNPTTTQRINDIKMERLTLQADIEETIEKEITRILQQEKLSSPIGVFPPVDVVFTSSPHLLILSPRDRIERKEDILLNPGLSILEKESIERDILLSDPELSIYIEDTGGVAVYPSVVTDTLGLQNATEIASHEWIHHWLFFKPMGRNFWSGPEMASLNETVASLAGIEIGDRVFTSLTGSSIERNQRNQPSNNPADNQEDFDFRSEMRQTRLKAEEFLAKGKIEEAEAYMENRRQIFIENGYPIRKLNQAYFAFHGTYAASAASISPIGDQVQQLRDNSDSLAHFLETVSGFSTYHEFLDHLREIPKIQEKHPS